VSADSDTRPQPEPAVELAHLRRLTFVRAGPGESAGDAAVVGTDGVGLSAEGQRRVEQLASLWEWVEAVVSSPALRARQTAAALAPQAPVRIDERLRPRDLGPWQMRPASALREAHPEAFEQWRAGDTDFDLPEVEAAASFRARVCALLEDLDARRARYVLVVSHLAVIRAITAALSAPLPAGRPEPAEMALVSRGVSGQWRLGRRTSDPEALRSPLERTGLSGLLDEPPSERHAKRLELAATHPR